MEKIIEDRSKLLTEILLSPDRSITEDEAARITKNRRIAYTNSLLDIQGIKHVNGSYVMLGDEVTTGFSKKVVAKINYQNSQEMLVAYAKLFKEEDRIAISEALQTRMLNALI